MCRRHGNRSAIFVFVVIATTLIYSINAQIHLRFTRDQLRQVFHVESHDEVPEYQVVEVRSLSKRDTNSDRTVHVKAFGKDYRLRLEKNDHLSDSAKHLKVLLADVKDGQLELQEELPAQKSMEIGVAYHDVKNEAAVTLRHDDNDGTLHMEGTIGKSLVIKPMPSILTNQVEHNVIITPTGDDEMFLDEDYNVMNPEGNSTGKESKTKGMHVVYARQQDDLGSSDYLLMEPDRLVVKNLHPKRRRKREAPDTIWPEVLVIADYDTYNMHGANSINIKRYFVSFWNGVDLRYKLLTGPRVRISLAGIIISKGRDATPYLENNRVKGDAVDSAAALTDMGKYLFRERRLPTYDLAVVVTKLDLCRKQFNSGNCNTGTAGFAYVGGACVVNSRLEKVNSVAIVEDTGGFSGIIVAAHEVGHLLGAVHDGSPAPNYLGGPGAEHCRWEDGYIMSDLRHTERGFQWSLCSIQQFQHFLNSDTATCLHNMPHEDEELPRILPGRMLSLDAQCRKDRGTSACFKDDRVCAQLFCFDSKSGYCVSYRPAAEGSPCGDGQFCINGRCVFEHDNFIPDFTKITETFVEPAAETAATHARPVFSKPELVQVTTSSSSGDNNVQEDEEEGDPIPVATALPVVPGRRRNLRTTRLVQLGSTPAQVLGNHPNEEDGVGCVDVMTTLAGGLTCKQFLRDYGHRYCSHPYIASNCCSSHQLLCSD